MNLADQERNALCDLFLSVGPDAPTLCEGWRTRDLAAHLIIRERRPDAAAGALLPFLAARRKRVQGDIARQPWESVVHTIRSGPPVWSPMRIDLVNKNTNTVEFYVHHEDVRRAASTWEPRAADRLRYAELKARLGPLGKLNYRKSPVSVTLDYLDGTTRAVRTVAGAPVVTVKGTPDEVVLFTFGRDAQSKVSLEGDPDAVAALQAASRGF
ncbi:uncharacterized protein (TIGR03085 family) [Antricoccus suffuscus]|uniref:Uncharacterized protein (TIGR03085 family) n=1 Tax=Antricoccus suffuscus TaxID=1629062 RepID=A0A2T1A4S7_9ACTN|nr:TIGR03085 family metal-binding protein [Antricoccus suffuscus]PRZ43603.1 uncharacterized protein (TIGR03085 family) [Antricoccus suffuscus]